MDEIVLRYQVVEWKTDGLDLTLYEVRDLLKNVSVSLRPTIVRQKAQQLADILNSLDLK